MRAATALAGALLVAFVRLAAGSDQVVFTAGEGGYACFRIPAMVTTKRALVAFAEARLASCGDHGSVDIVVKTSSDGGDSWTPLRVVHSESSVLANVTIGNPAPVYLPASDTVLLAFTRHNLDVLVTDSNDEGMTWSVPRDITFHVRKYQWNWVATGPGSSIVSASGRVVVPTDIDFEGGAFSTVLYSDDGGISWAIGGLVAEGNEATVAEPAPGLLVLNMRAATPVRARLQSLSTDGGLTWTPAQVRADLPDPQCQGSMLSVPLRCPAAAARLRAQAPAPPPRVLLLSNVDDPSSRQNLTLSVSLDAGRTWTAALTLAQGSSAYSVLSLLPNAIAAAPGAGAEQRGSASGDATIQVACLYEASSNAHLLLARPTLQLPCPSNDRAPA